MNILTLFGAGLDTLEIALKIGRTEAYVYNHLHGQRETRRLVALQEGKRREEKRVWMARYRAEREMA